MLEQRSGASAIRVPNNADRKLATRAPKVTGESRRSANPVGTRMDSMHRAAGRCRRDQRLGNITKEKIP